MRINIRPIPVYSKQADFVHLSTWLRGFCGGRGTGKTWIGAFGVQSSGKDGQSYTAVSPDSGVVMETTFPTFEEIARDTGRFIRKVLSPYPKIWWRTADRGMASIVFRSAEKPDKLAGASKAGLWFDEASLISREAFDIAIPTLRHKGFMGPCWLTFTPRGTKHWTFTECFTPVDWQEGDPMPDGGEVIQGKVYRPKANSRLIRAHTLDNPFLPPEFFGNIRERYSSKLAQQELAGEFIDIAGLMFRRESFGFVEEAPRNCQRLRYWDRASTPGSGSYSAGVLLAVDDRGIWYVEDVKRGQWSYEDRNQIMKQTADMDGRKYRNEVLIYTEQEGGSGGKEVSQQIVKMLAGHPVYVHNVGGGGAQRVVGGERLPGEAKITRALGLSAQVEAGNFRLVRGQWNTDYLDEVTAFPEYRYSDQVDATSGAFNLLAKGVLADPGAAERAKVETDTSRFGALLTLSKMRESRFRGARSS